MAASSCGLTQLPRALRLHDTFPPVKAIDRQEEREAEPPIERASLVVRPGLFLTLVIGSALGAGALIYWLLRSMRI
jgi:hypothetical protein